jgi:hypothetical protein
VLGTKSYQDKDMEKPEVRSGAVPLPLVPGVIFANWREVLNQSGQSAAARGGYALAIGGYLDRRNGHAQALSACVSTRPGGLPRGHPRPPAEGYSPSDQPVTPHAWGPKLGKADHLLLLRP